MNMVRAVTYGDLTARLGALATGVGFVVSVAALPVAVTSGGIRWGFGETAIRLDSVAVLMLMLVLGLSALIQSFAVRYLRSDSRQLWFVAAATLLTGFTGLMVCAGSVAVFVVGWIGAGIALVLLLGTYRHLPQARQGVERTAIRFLISDGGLLVAVIVVMVAGNGDVSFERLGAVTAALPIQLQLTVAVLMVTAALARCSQIPFEGWLPFTLAAPTPVSALMHAGVVNGGAILLLRFAPTVAEHKIVMILVLVSGAATMVYASAVRMVRADVKGRLVFSTMAQMGFMIMVCGLGLYSAAIFHLIAHSLYKSALFLGAGMGVREKAVDRDLPSRRPTSAAKIAATVALAVTVPAAGLIGAKIVLSPAMSEASLGLLGFVAITASVAVAHALVTNFTARTIFVGAVAVGVLAFGYVAFLHLFTEVLEPVSGLTAAPAWLLVFPACALLVVQVLAFNPNSIARMRNVVFTRSLTSTVSRPLPATAGVS